MSALKDQNTQNEKPENDKEAEIAVKKQDTEISGVENQETKTNEEVSGEKKEEKSPEQMIQELKEETAVLKDQLLRKQADYENFRKRLFREKDESIKFANQMLLLDITTIIDDFERAMKSAEESKDFDAFHKGIVMIENQLVSMLEKKWELKRFDSAGEVFDPDRHLAIAVEESGDYTVPTVLEDYQKGYLFHERVLRPAKVKVSQPIAKDEDTFDKNNQESDNDKE
ncbi:MAG: nucleotide exchange factor GrpE [Spirochaetales bacterium]|nr:nucleotide exchange factor GrpE [Spirochaetales bacterium]